MKPLSSAQVALAQAESRLKSSSGFFSFSTAKYKEAGDLFQDAANGFKHEQLFKESGDAFGREAECRERCKERDMAANAWWNAAKAYKQGYPDMAIKALTETIKHLTAPGQLRHAADREKEIGQIYLGELGDLRKAAEAYEQAAWWYDQEDVKESGSSCKKDAADLWAQLDEFPRAMSLYDEVAQHSLESELKKCSVKDYWLRAGLCALATQDVATARRQFDGYSRTDITFPSTREAKFLLALVNAVENSDEEAFTESVIEYDQVTKLDTWETRILLKIKKGFPDCCFFP